MGSLTCGKPRRSHVCCSSTNLSLAFPATRSVFAPPPPLLLLILSLQNPLSLILCEKAEILGRSGR